MKIIRIALIATCMLCLRPWPMTLGACVAGEILPSTPIRLQSSWYSRADLIRDGQDKRTHFIMANGKEFDENKLTCASWDYKLGTYIRVRNNANGKSVVVKVTDRTARRFKGKRVDLSKYAFTQISDCKQGIVSVSITEVK